MGVKNTTTQNANSAFKIRNKNSKNELLPDTMTLDKPTTNSTALAALRIVTLYHRAEIFVFIDVIRSLPRTHNQ